MKKKLSESEIMFIKKEKAHNLVAYAIERGKLIPQPCEVCGENKVDAHHDDYDKPLDVRWLCRKDHMEHHHPNKMTKKAGLKIYLDKKTHKALKVETAKNNTTMQAVIEDAIKVYVGHKIPATSQK